MAARPASDAVQPARSSRWAWVRARTPVRRARRQRVRGAASGLRAHRARLTGPHSSRPTVSLRALVARATGGREVRSSSRAAAPAGWATRSGGGQGSTPAGRATGRNTHSTCPDGRAAEGATTATLYRLGALPRGGRAAALCSAQLVPRRPPAAAQPARHRHRFEHRVDEHVVLGGQVFPVRPLLVVQELVPRRLGRLRLLLRAGAEAGRCFLNLIVRARF